MSRKVALTFDMEHPSRADHDPGGPARILDHLKDADTQATFFIQGRWARTQPVVTQRVRAEGHLVGCHSHFHAPLVSLTDEGIRQDLGAATDALAEVSGASPQPWFRCPFGAGHDDERVLRVIEECGYRNVHWNVEPMDWVEGRTADDVVTSVVDGVDRSSADAVILLHTWPSATVAALPTLLSELPRRGHTFVRVDELDQLVLESGI